VTSSDICLYLYLCSFWWLFANFFLNCYRHHLSALSTTNLLWLQCTSRNFKFASDMDIVFAVLSGYPWNSWTHVFLFHFTYWNQVQANCKGLWLVLSEIFFLIFGMLLSWNSTVHQFFSPLVLEETFRINCKVFFINEMCSVVGLIWPKHRLYLTFDSVFLYWRLCSWVSFQWLLVCY